MRRGGFGKESSDQPEPMKVTPLQTVLHPATRVVIGVAFVAGSIAGLFLWDWRYVAAGFMVVLGGLIVGPWRPPKPPHFIESPPLEWPDDLKGLG